jgi:sarcosine oxidase, subunit beta
LHISFNRNPEWTSMKFTGDVLVIGAGLAGASVAYQIARRGRRVIVLDRGDPGAQTSRTNQGGVRVQFADSTHILAARKTLELIEDFAEEFGVEPDFKRIGYLFLFQSGSTAQRFEAAARVQNSLGCNTEVLSSQEISARWPKIRSDDLVGGTYNPTDGRLEATALVHGYCEAARRYGAQLFAGEEVIAVRRQGDKILEVETATNRYSAGVIVNAGGPWAPQLAKLYDRQLPIDARLSPIFVTDQASDGLGHPMTLDIGPSVTICPHPEGVLIGGTEKVIVDSPCWTPRTDWTKAPKMLGKAAHRYPYLSEHRIVGSRTGYWEVSPDDMPIIGADSSLNIFTTAGYSGHGICIIPGLANSIAQAILGEETELDLSKFHPERFVHTRAMPAELWGTADWAETDTSRGDSDGV